MNILKVCGVVLLCVGAAAAVKKTDSTFAKLICLCGFAGVAAAVVNKLKPAVEYAEALANSSGAGGYLTYVIKAIALVYISEFTSSICTEAGEAFLGRAVTTFARAEILIISLPLFREIIDFALSLC